MRVLVVRPLAEAEATGRRLAERGHAALLAPVLVIEPTGTEPPDIDPEALVVTSANAVPAAIGWRDRFGARPVYAVGARTARALGEGGFARILPGGGDGRDLARRIAGEVRPGAALLHLAGRDRNPEPGRSLEAAGYRVAVWEVYAARGADRLPDIIAEALEAGRLDAVLHYSRRSAGTLADLAQAAGRGQALARLAHACLSAEAARGLAGLGPVDAAVADRPTEAALLDALDGLAESAPPGRARPAAPPGARDGTIPEFPPLRTAKDHRPR